MPEEIIRTIKIENLSSPILTAQVLNKSGSGADHSDLLNLSADDHPQYLNIERGDIRYYQKSEVDTAIADAIIGGDGHVEDFNNPHQVTATQVGLGNVDNTSDANKPISILTQGALDLKANSADVYTQIQIDGFLGDKANSADVYTQSQIDGFLGDKANSADVYTQSQIDIFLGNKANALDLTNHISNISNPHQVTATQVGLGNVDNTSDANKPISTATQSALDLKANQSTTYTKIEVDTQISNLVNSAPETLDTLNELASALGDDPNFATTVTNLIGTKANSADVYTQIQIDGFLGDKANALDLTNHISDTSNPHSVTKDQVGLGNVDNTSDANKPISTATQSALDLKANALDLTNHISDTSNPHGVTSIQVGLGNVDNTSDADKPISTATQSALDLKANALDLTNHISDTSNPHNVTLDQLEEVDISTTAPLEGQTLVWDITSSPGKFIPGTVSVVGSLTDLSDVGSITYTDGHVLRINGSNQFVSAQLNPSDLSQEGATTNQVLQWDGNKWAPGVATGTGDVSTDSIWTTKGDLAVGTGASSAQILPVGAGTDTYVLTADSAEVTGLKWAPAPGGAASVTVSDTPPTSPSPGDLWFNSSIGTMYIYYDNYWVTTSSPVGAEQLSDLTDVIDSTPTNKNFLIADGADWTSRALVAADINSVGVIDNYVLTSVGNVTQWAPAQGGGSGMITGISLDNGANVNVEPRSVLNFIQGSNISITIDDDPAGDEVDITISSTGGGGLTATPTPTDNQVAVWTSGTNLEGTTGLTFDGTDLNVNGNITLTGTVDGVDIAARDHNAVTLTNVPSPPVSFITLDGNQNLTINEVDLTSDVTGILPVANGGTGASDPAGARAALGVDEPGTDNSTPVTLTNVPSPPVSFLTLDEVNQILTVDEINLTTDVQGVLPAANIGSHTHTSDEITDFDTAVDGRISANAVQDGDTLTTGLTFPTSGLKLRDTNDTHNLIVSAGSDLTADRTLTFNTGDQDRTLNIQDIEDNTASRHAPTTLVNVSSPPVSFLTLSGQELTVNEIDLTADVQGVLPVANGGTGASDVGTARTNLGLGTISTQDSDNVNITGGTISGLSSLSVTGNLTVLGTTTTINSTELTVDDKNIELGSVDVPTDITADGGGITLKGSTDKTFNWVDATDSWTSSENLDLASGKSFKIAGADVLTSTTLGSSVTTSSLTTVGTISTGTWTATDIAIEHGGTGASDAATARTNLGVAIGTNVQAQNDLLQDIAGIGATSTGADQFIVSTGAGTFALEDAATARASLGVDEPGTDNSTPVTLTNVPSPPVSFLTLSGQELTVDEIDLAADVKGLLPEANIGSHTHASGDIDDFNTSVDSRINTFIIDEDDMASDTDTKVPTQQSVKAYVDTEIGAAVTGLLDYKGGYDPTTDTLESSPSGVLKGDAYTITAQGDFLGITVETGDMIIAEVDGAGPNINDWTVVSKQIDLATESSPGIVTLAPSGAQTSGLVVQGNDARLSDARPPTAHAATHKHGGLDEIATATPAANAIPKATAGGVLADGWISESSVISALSNTSTLAQLTDIQANDRVLIQDLSVSAGLKYVNASELLGGSGSVATDIIWDNKGDLAVGTGVDTAEKLSALGVPDNYVLTTDSAETTGLKWALPAGGLSDGDTLTLGFEFPATTLKIQDAGSPIHSLSLSYEGGADSTLTVDTGDLNRVLTFTGDATISGTNTGDQNLANISTQSTDVAQSLYTMSAGIPVEFESSDNNTLLYLDETSETVLIGTDTVPTSPALDYKLHMEGNGSGTSGRTAFTVKNTNASSAAQFRLLQSSGGSVIVQAAGPSYTTPNVGIIGTANGLSLRIGTDGESSSGGTNDVIFGPGGYANDTVWFKPDGKVGVGTSIPETLFHISESGGLARSWSAFAETTLLFEQGDVTRNADLSITSDRAKKAGIFFGDQDDQNPGSVYYDNNTDSLNFGTNNTLSHVIVDSSGQVGIGTTTPGTKLEIAGQIKITGGTPGLNKVLTSDATGLASWQDPTGGINDGDVLTTGLTFPATGLKIQDAGSPDHVLTLSHEGSADSTLTLDTGDTNRTLTLAGDATISGTTSGINSGDISLTHIPSPPVSFLTLSGQELTVDEIDLTTDVKGILPAANGGTGASDAGTARTNLGAQQQQDILDDIGALSPPVGENEVLVSIGPGTFALESGNVLRTSLGLGLGDSPQFTGLTLSGDLTVNGTTTTVNSTIVTLDDPIITLGGDTAPVVDDNKDRGVEFRWYDGAAKVGFFGFDDSSQKFTFIPDATNTSEVFSGTVGDAAFGNLDLTGNITVGGTVDGIDIAARDHDAVSLVNVPSPPVSFLTLSGQELTVDEIDLTTDVKGILPVANGGTGATTISGAQQALNLEPGVDVQTFNEYLADISAITSPTEGDLIRWNGTDWVKYADSNFATAGQGNLASNALQDGDTLSTGLEFPATGLKIQDAGSPAYRLTLSHEGSADSTLTIDTGDTNRTLTFTGDATISGTNTGDQDASQVSFNNTTSGLTGADVQAIIDDLDANVDDLITLTGIAENITHLGTFTGITITDNVTIKTALQELETAVEGAGGGSSTLAGVSTTSDDATKSKYTLTNTIPVEFASSEGNTILYLDETNEHIGVGTNVPSTDLHVSGGFRLENGTQGLNYVLTSDATGLATWQPATGGGNVSDGQTLATGLTFPATGLKIQDAGSPDHVLTLSHEGSADSTLTLDTGDVNRTLTFTGDATVSGTNTGDQDATQVSYTGTLTSNDVAAALDELDAAVAAAGGGGGGGVTEETTIYIDAGAFLSAPNGASPSTGNDAGTNNSVDWWNVAITEKLFAKLAMPPQWDGGTVSVDIFWTVQGISPEGETVAWSAAAQAAGNDDPWDTAFSSPVTSADDTVSVNGDIHVINIPSITPGGTPVDGDLLFFQIERVTPAGGTSLPEDARLLGIRVHYHNTKLQSWYINKMGIEAEGVSGIGEKSAWVAPADGYIHAIHSGCSFATIGSSLTVDVQKNGLSILTTKGVIAAGDDSTTTGTAHVLNASPVTFLAGDRISFHVDTFGGSGGNGLHTDLLISWD